MPTARRPSNSSPAQKRQRLSPTKPQSTMSPTTTSPTSPSTATKPEDGLATDPTTPSADSPTDATPHPPIPELAPPDSHIDARAAITYWSSVPTTVSGVLGGYPGLSRTDVQGSANFVAKMRKEGAAKAQGDKRTFPGPGEKLRRVVDCGAGIGRISVGFLGKVALRVDVVEPVKGFCEVVRGEGREGELKGRLGKVWEVGLEDWVPFGETEVREEVVDGDGEDTAGRVLDTQPYDLIWNQWCVGQLTDKQLTEYLARSIAWLSQGGFIVVKENLSNHPLGQDIFDETDSSVTRTKEKFESIFEEAGLKVVKTELQRGFPRELYPVRIWGLQPK